MNRNDRQRPFRQHKDLSSPGADANADPAGERTAAVLIARLGPIA
jgi:hypothetical protein